jgi:hypothetical protein
LAPRWTRQRAWRWRLPRVSRYDGGSHGHSTWASARPAGTAVDALCRVSLVLTGYLCHASTCMMHMVQWAGCRPCVSVSRRPCVSVSPLLLPGTGRPVRHAASPFVHARGGSVHSCTLTHRCSSLHRATPRRTCCTNLQPRAQEWARRQSTGSPSDPRLCVNRGAAATKRGQ